MRGRRRVGKSRLVEEFVDRAGVPHLFFTASAQPTLAADLALFVEAVVGSSLPGAQLFAAQRPEHLGRRAHPAGRRPAEQTGRPWWCSTSCPT